MNDDEGKIEIERKNSKKKTSLQSRNCKIITGLPFPVQAKFYFQAVPGQFPYCFSKGTNEIKYNINLKSIWKISSFHLLLSSCTCFIQVIYPCPRSNYWFVFFNVQN